VNKVSYQVNRLLLMQMNKFRKKQVKKKRLSFRQSPLLLKENLYYL